MSIVALIPARGGSKSVLSKNIKRLNNKPLIYYAISVARQAKSIDRIVVSTDDHKIAEIAEKYGAEVPFIRPKELSGDEVPDFPVIEHAVHWFDNHSWKVELIVFLRPTNIFRTAGDIDKAVKKVRGSEFDSVRGISKAAYPPYWMKRIVGDRLVPFIETGYEESRRQDLPDVYQGNGTIEVIKRETIIKKKTRFGDKVGFIIMDDIANVDIDSELDFKMAASLYPWWQKIIREKEII